MFITNPSGSVRAWFIEAVLYRDRQRPATGRTCSPVRTDTQSEDNATDFDVHSERRALDPEYSFLARGYCLESAFMAATIGVLHRHPVFIAEPGATHLKQRAGAPLRKSSSHGIGDLFAARLYAQYFFGVISFIISISRSHSATSFLSLPFSARDGIHMVPVE
ncbi:MAG: hypothetical protein ACYCOR_09605 [Acidobacteriaceae bacterium]